MEVRKGAELSQQVFGILRKELGRWSQATTVDLEYYRRRPRRLQEQDILAAKPPQNPQNGYICKGRSDLCFPWHQTATAVAHAREGRGLIRINGSPINLVQPEILRLKVYEPVLVAGEDSFAPLDIRVRVKGGGHTSQVYAIRQAISKALVAYYAKYLDAYSALELKKKLVAYDRTLLIADPRRMEPKKFGGHGARARRQKRAGANVCSDPREARVILVDSSSPQGRLFIRDWGKDTNKVVLEYTWVKKSITADKVLDEDERWGGCLTLDDGLPIVKDEAQDMENPLPTPRITPVEVPRPQRRASAPQLPTPVDTYRESSLPITQSIASALPSSPDPDVSSSSTLPHSQLPAHVMAALVAQSQAMSQQSFSQSQPPNMMPNFQYQPSPANMSSQTIMNFMNMNPAYLAFLQQNMMAWNPNFGYTSHILNQYPQDPMTMPSHPTSLQGSPPSIPPSIRRKSPVLSRSTSPSYVSYGSVRSESPAHYLASSSAPTPSSTSSALLSTLFRTETQGQLSFFVQVDLRDRGSVVSAIKFDELLESTLAAGKPAVNASFVHDCVTQHKLLDTSSYEFDPPKPSSRARGKRKREISHNDEEETVEDRAERKRLERNRRQTERRNALKLKEEITTPVKKGKHVSKISAKSHSQPTPKPIQSVADDPSRPRSPTPPPEHTRKRRGTGEGYYYSEHEYEYCKRYVKVLLERDHKMTMSAIAQALYKKAKYAELLKRASIAYRKAQVQQDGRQMQKAEEGPSGSATISRSPSPRKEVPSSGGTIQENIVQKEVEFVAQFFATGGGQEEDSRDEDIENVWARLAERVRVCI
ncbi:hypothetical protein H0H81_011203 [Sphagnurus paluster]|uniref:40S ribosomal protein S16 n=1 Tax=Sphagnurus paluster TaxID=117069 RepID=A0A9P7K558_9AGAR|nr:hypothetical protein H0H81_011203 [Sphagnurus paluster]